MKDLWHAFLCGIGYHVGRGPICRRCGGKVPEPVHETDDEWIGNQNVPNRYDIWDSNNWKDE